MSTSGNGDSDSAAGDGASPVRSIALMVAASGLLTVNDAIVKWLAQSYPVGQVMTLRGVFVIGSGLYIWNRELALARMRRG